MNRYILNFHKLETENSFLTGHYTFFAFWHRILFLLCVMVFFFTGNTIPLPQITPPGTVDIQGHAVMFTFTRFLSAAVAVFLFVSVFFVTKPQAIEVINTLFIVVAAAGILMSIGLLSGTWALVVMLLRVTR
jgi:hypothetical protein